MKDEISLHAKQDMPEPLTYLECLQLVAKHGLAKAMKLEAKHNGYRGQVPPSTISKQGFNEQMAIQAKLRRERILDFLKENDGATAGEIRKATGFSPANLSDYTRRMRKQRLIHTRKPNGNRHQGYYLGPEAD